MTADELAKRIEELSKQREQTLAQANQQIGNLDGQLLVLRQWLASLQDKK